MYVCDMVGWLSAWFCHSSILSTIFFTERGLFCSFSLWNQGGCSSSRDTRSAEDIAQLRTRAQQHSRCCKWRSQGKSQSTWAPVVDIRAVHEMFPQTYTVLMVGLAPWDTRFKPKLVIHMCVHLCLCVCVHRGTYEKINKCQLDFNINL